MVIRKRSRLLAPWIALLALAGCDDGLMPVSGTVTIDGQPLAHGQIRMVIEGGRTAIGNLQPDGSFTLTSLDFGDGVPPGTHLVTISAVEGVNERSQRWHAPKRYASKTASQLWVTIEDPTKALSLELTWEGSGHNKPFVERF
ncbi:MAG: carboxypeptidase-like regulatory domain-containing protein [Planctomycetota bacterium]